MSYGRDAETSVIDELLAKVGSGGSGAPVVSGEPGIGKTALPDYAAKNTEGVQLIHVLAVSVNDSSAWMMREHKGDVRRGSEHAAESSSCSITRHAKRGRPCG
jgi:predicted ATP-dependent serine protease